MAPPFRLLDLATELQDMIEELHFSSGVFNISEALPYPPYLEVLRTRKDQEKYSRTKETCYKHATFQVREENLQALLHHAQPHVAAIQEIRLDGVYLNIDQYVQPKYATALEMSPFQYWIIRKEKIAMAEIGGERLKEDEAELREMGLIPFTIKMPVQIMDGGNVVWKEWAHSLDLKETVKRALDLAKYPDEW